MGEVAGVHRVVDARQAPWLEFEVLLDAPDVAVAARSADQLGVLLGLSLEPVDQVAVEPRVDVGVHADPERGQGQGEQRQVGEHEPAAEAHRPASGSSRST
jgi:hypothetical protein